MTIQEALAKAREGGYQREFKHREPSLRAVVVGLHTFRTIQVDDFSLDPECWRTLGHTLGWQPERVLQRQWQRFIDHLAQGNTPASFFATL